MKKILLFSFLLLIFPCVSYADVNVSVKNNGNSNVSVDSQSSGTITTCTNGNCTTTGGESNSKVCVNGNCTESNGDITVSEENANVKVQH